MNTPKYSPVIRNINTSANLIVGNNPDIVLSLNNKAAHMKAVQLNTTALIGLL